MSRRRWRITLLAALATLAAVYPITSLFQRSDWLLPACFVIALTAGLGLLLRGLSRSRVLVVAVQVLVVAYVVLVRYAGDTFLLLVPTVDTGVRVAELGQQALDTIGRYSAPAPLNDGVSFCLVVAVGLVAICVDATAATWRSPAASGLPLLTAYLITAANGQSALALRYFVVPVVLWLVMLHTTALAQFGRWSTTSAVDDGVPALAAPLAPERSAMQSFSSGAAKLGLAGLVLALVVPVFVPHFPPRYLTEGLGRTSGAGAGDGSVGYNDTLDLTRSLSNDDVTPVLAYTTTGFTRSPLRVAATSAYSNGQWRAGSSRQGAPQPLPPPDQRRDYELTVTDNTLAVPRIAAPFPVVAVAMEGTPWTIDPVTRDVRVSRAVSTYRVTYADLAPVPSELRDSGVPNSPDVTDEDLQLPDSARELIETWSAEVTSGEANPLDKAIAIQNHLRDSSRYRYDLDLGEPLRDSAGRIVEPIRTFYETRRGYCVQFSTAMIMLARAQGIPARMAMGFLPGTAEDGKYVVRASDAHAWPELYFQGFGWLRFEPTPGSRSGTPPPYTVASSDDAGGGAGRNPDATATGGSTSSGAATTTPALTPTGVPETSVVEQLGSVFSLRNVVTALTVLVLLLALFVMPLTAALSLRRRRREAATRQDLIEVEWDDLTSHLRDLGLPDPEGGTLRQLRDRFVREGHLDPQNAAVLGRVTATLEKSRYDRPERTTVAEADALHRDIRLIRREAGRTRAASMRLRSFFWPEAGVSVWRSLPERLTARLRRRG